LAVLFITFILSSCRLDEKIAFDIDYDEEATIPSIVGINLPFEIPIPPITTNIDNKLSDKDSKKDYLNTAYLKELSIISKDPSDQDLDFLKNIEVFIKADGLSEIKIAERIDIPKNIGTELILEVFSDEDIAEYLKKDEFNLRVKVTARKIVLHSVKVEIKSTFRITTDIF